MSSLYILDINPLWRPQFNSWVSKIHWRRESLPTPVFWPGEFHALWSMGLQGVGHDWVTFTPFTHYQIYGLQIFFFSIGCLFILLIASFVVQKLLSLILCLMFILDFVAYTLGVIAEKSLPRSMLRSFCFLLGVSDFTFTFHFYTLEKEMATHSSVLAWRIPGMGSHRVGHDWSDLAAAGVLWFQDFCLDRQSIFS